MRPLLPFIVALSLVAADRGRVTLESSDARLVQGFEWAKARALAYAFTGDPVGDWYEASLPGRQAFCMRDVSHQSTGAQVLGLAPVTRNMLRHFAASVADSRDWCGYWEIEKSGRPAPVDYKNDRDFWYNLPANFDLLRCCYRQYRWTGDRAYLEDPAFLNFYRRTVDDYVKRWDKDGDGVPESYREYGHRGIGSYDEDLEFHVLVGADLVAAQSAAYGAYAAIADLLGERDTAGRYRALEQKLRAWFNESWWDAGHRSFYRALKQDRTFLSRPDEAVPAIWFDIVDPGAKTAAALDALSARNVEVRSYYPEIAYRYERCETGYARLMELTDPALLRREYPEVSYAVLGAIAEGLMGVDPDARSRTVATYPRLTRDTAWAKLSHLPVFDGEIDLHHTGRTQSEFRNRTTAPLQWRASFPGAHARLLVDGKLRPASAGTRRDGSVESYVILPVAAGQQRMVKVH